MNQTLVWFQRSLVCSLLLVSTTTPVRSQIVPDNTLGAENSSLTPNVVINGSNADRIDGGAQRGSHLFHSFSRFNINDGQRVYFANPLGIQNIFTRVTGGEGSNILGTLGVEGTANLFLMNPNGILFGKDARLDVRGSFVGTTANAVRFGETLFSATNPEAPPLLTINPSALFFTQSNPGTIINQSQAPAGINPEGNNSRGLRVPDGQSLLLVGGNINMDGGRLRAFGGRVELASLAAPSNVGLNVAGNTLSLDIPGDVQRGDISLANEASVSVFANGGGDIVLNARNVEMSNSALAGGIAEGTNSLGARAGDIRINATESITITNSDIFNDVSGVGNGGNVFIQASNDVALSNANIFSNVESKGIGNSGNINIRASSLTLKDSAQLQTSVKQADEPIAAIQRNAGDINIDVQGAVTITGRKDNRPSAIFSDLETGATGRGGNINIKSGSFTLSDGALLSASTFGTGDAGSVLIQASNDVSLTNATIFSNVESGGIGNGGDISIQARTLTLNESAQLQTSVKEAGDSTQSLAGQGNAGDINIDVQGAVTITGRKDNFSSAIFSSLGTGATGRGGNIDIKSASFTLSDGALLSASTFGTGDAGSVLIQASNDVSLTNATIFSNVESGGIGNGGDISIQARTLTLNESAQLQTSVNEAEVNNNTQSPAGQGKAGNVNIDVSGDVTITGRKDNRPSAIFSRLGTGATGRGGNINIKSGSFTLSDGARLFADSFGQGNAGDVNIDVSGAVTITGRKDNFSSAIFSDLETGATGRGGNINIKSASFTLSDGAQLHADSFGQGNAGNVNIDVLGAVTITGRKDNFSSAISSNLGTGATGRGGNINIKSASFTLSNGAQLSASTSGKGDAGSVLIQASNDVALTNATIFSTVESGGIGNSGDISIQARSLTLNENAQLLTFVTEADATQSVAGQRNAGNVNIDVSGAVTITGRKDNLPSAISSNLGTGATGRGGNINIKSASFTLSDGALLSASTFGTGDAGSVLIQASNDVALTNATIFSNVESGGIGNSGDISIQARSLTLNENAQLQTIVNEAEEDNSKQSPAGQGKAGNVIIDVSGDVTITGRKDNRPSAIFSTLGTGATGRGGNINIKSGSFTLSDGAQLYADSFGQGNAGNVNIDVLGAVTITGRKDNFSSAISSNLGTGATGRGGNINIKSASFTLSDGAQLVAGTSGTGDAGSVLIQASNDVTLTNATIFSTVESGGIGNGGDISVKARTLTLKGGAQLQTSVKQADNNTQSLAGQGNAGNVNIDVLGIVTITGRKDNFSSAIFSNLATGATGRGGNINIISSSFSLSDNALLNTSTFGTGDAGTVSIKTTEDITLKNSAQIRADTGGNGNAGNVTLMAGGTVFLDGTTASTELPTGISTEATKEPGFVGRGKAGDINITAGNLSINRAILTAGNSGEGTVGDININTRSIQLDNEGKIVAESNSGNGGNVNITATDFLLLRRGSSISTTAGKANLEGDGGNITINTPFIIAVPNENSDITANAFTGRGGNVNINARNIFGIQARPKPTSASDITASSELGVQGQVAIAQPDIQSTQKLIELPNEVIDATSQVAQICPKGIHASSLSQFIITGRGSLPPNPLEPLVGTPELSRLATLDGDDSANTSEWKPKEVETMTDFNTTTEIIEAQSLVKTADGSVMLVASAPEATSSSINFPVQSQTACSSENLDKTHHVQSNH